MRVLVYFGVVIVVALGLSFLMFMLSMFYGRKRS